MKIGSLIGGAGQQSAAADFGQDLEPGLRGAHEGALFADRDPGGPLRRFADHHAEFGLGEARDRGAEIDIHLMRSVGNQRQGVDHLQGIDRGGKTILRGRADLGTCRLADIEHAAQFDRCRAGDRARQVFERLGSVELAFEARCIGHGGQDVAGCDIGIEHLLIGAGLDVGFDGQLDREISGDRCRRPPASGSP